METSTQEGTWEIPSNWRELAGEPKAWSHFDGIKGHARDSQEQLDNMTDTIERLTAISERVMVVAMPSAPKMEALYKERSSYPAIEELCREMNVPFYRKTLREWGLDVRHFFGSKFLSPEMIDWSHLNYPGSYVFSEALGRLAAEEFQKHKGGPATTPSMPSLRSPGHTQIRMQRR